MSKANKFERHDCWRSYRIFISETFKDADSLKHYEAVEIRTFIIVFLSLKVMVTYAISNSSLRIEMCRQSSIFDMVSRERFS